MCGIVSYIGKSEAIPLLLDGLRRLEYRGYDSAGIGVSMEGCLTVRKSVGRIRNLEKLLAVEPASGYAGISHTRWATHGTVTVENAHPHTDQSGDLLLVHNGVIENYRELREMLLAEGHVFSSQTDTEVLAHLIGRECDQRDVLDREGWVACVRAALKQIIGTYGLALLHAKIPGVIVVARRGSPLAIGIGQKEHYIASDIAAFAHHTREVIYLNDNEIACVTAEQCEVSTLAGDDADYEVSKVEFSAEEVDLGSYPHYMLKEIFEQPLTVGDAMRGRLSFDEACAHLGGLNMSNAELRNVERMVLTGCGTAFHAALAGEYLIESLTQIPVECEFASEFRYRNLPLMRNTLVFVLSQSGETADTLAALRESQRKGCRTLGICNHIASSIARESDGGVYMHAGPEVGVAATKSFTSQLTILALLGLLLGRIRFLSHADGLSIVRELEALPEKLERCLLLHQQMEALAEKYCAASHFLFMGRQMHYPIALEAALKLKEITYIPASGHPSAELKHGVIALIQPTTPSFFIAPNDSVFEKNLSNIEEVKARGGPVIAIGTEGRTKELRAIADDVIEIPSTLSLLSPILSVVPFQLFAYHLGVKLGRDVDKPRNLAKSVTVE